MLPVLKVEGLTKTYGKKNVVDDVTFSVFAGQIFGFVGPNGAFLCLRAFSVMHRQFVSSAPKAMLMSIN